MKHNFKFYCKDYKNIENYHKAKADDFVGWICHHRKGVDIPTEELQALGMYYNRPAEELIFLTISEHIILHKKGKKRKPMSDEAKIKLSISLKGRPVSEEHRKKLSEAAKGKHKGMHWYNNGKECKFCFECPEGFVPGRIKKP